MSRPRNKENSKPTARIVRNKSLMDIKLYYQEKGNGMPLVLLHGNGQDGSYFRSQVDFFF